MDISITVLDQAGEIAHRSQLSVDGLMLTVAAESRQVMAQENGPDWTHGAITFFGRELIDAVQKRKPVLEFERNAINLATAVWVVGSVFEGLKTEQFINSNIAFTIAPDGTVRYDRIEKPN